MIATNIGANTQTVGFDYGQANVNVVDNGMSSSVTATFSDSLQVILFFIHLPDLSTVGD